MIAFPRAGTAPRESGRSPYATSLRAYAAERYPARLFLPLAGFLAAAALAGGGAAGALDVVAAALAWTLVFQFRLWDDLADRARDRAEHPGRVLARSEPAPFVALAAALIVLNGALVAFRGGPARLGVFALLSALLLAWYRRRPAGAGWALFGAHVVLAKYAAIVYLAAPSAAAPYPGRLALAALQVFLCFAVHEILHDRRLAAAPGATAALALQMALLALLPALAWSTLRAGPLSAAYGAAALAAAAVLAALFRRHLAARPAGGGAAYAVFAVTFPLLFILSIGGVP
ncbi:MAG: hypothetical protein HY561_12110 [Gemmatimonadetes bacterium]|nr:hypothetical protein [Gemmatimonadota bacterium]